MKRILITGASGFIGKRLYRSFVNNKPIGAAFNISDQDKAEDIIDIDLRDEYNVRSLFEEYSPDTVYHFAALVVPKINEEHPELARQMHLDVTKNILKNMKKGSRIIFLSTDKVFDGSDTCPDESSQPMPTSLYGQLKLEAENMIREQTQKHHIFRLPIVHDSGDINSTSFVDKSLIALKKGDTVSAFTNVKRCYIKIDELIKLLVKSADNEDYGIYHVGCDMGSYFERIEKVCEETGIDPGGRLKKGTGAVVPLIQNLNREKVKKVFRIEFN